jgi:hypothetical protein
MTLLILTAISTYAIEPLPVLALKCRVALDEEYFDLLS